MSFRQGDQRSYLAVSGGFAEVLREKVSILARTTESAEDIDLERAERAKAAAEKVLKVDTSEAPFRNAEIKLLRALCRISVHSRPGI
jgi:F-type H+-transporting ATPase subunit epsilon